MRAPAPRAKRAAPERTLALTILLHGDPARIGWWCKLGIHGKLSRLEPEFSPPQRGSEPSRQARSPLGDPNLSRKPIEIEALDDGSVRLAPASHGTEIRVDGVLLAAPMVVSGVALARGVCLELASRVVLLLHRRIEPIPDLKDCGLVGDSEAVDRLRQQILQVADLDIPVLLRGPTGAGKELVAQALHRLSHRGNRELQSTNLVTLPASMAASELFGHRKGAFTGAETGREGLFARANGSTLFLDEVAETTLELQAMLLRVLETQQIRPLGGEQEEAIDVRLISATDADLELNVAEGSFREPLLHRLAGFQIALPSLRERPDDIMRLLVHFLREELERAKEPNHLEERDASEPLWIPSHLATRLTRYPWPGNVRELRNVARHIVVASRAMASRAATQIRDDEFLQALVQDSVTSTSMTAADARPSELTEQRLIEVLRTNDWKPGNAARALGISKTSLYALMEKSPNIRKARDLSAEEILASARNCDSDTKAMARSLEVSERGLKLRLRELELQLG